MNAKTRPAALLLTAVLAALGCTPREAKEVVDQVLFLDTVAKILGDRCGS